MMKKLIKKILREGFDDLDWIRDTNPLYDIFSGSIFIDNDISDPNMVEIQEILFEYDYTWVGDRYANIFNGIQKFVAICSYSKDEPKKIGMYSQTTGSYPEEKRQYIEEGKYFTASQILNLSKKYINESEDDLDWIRDIPTNPFTFDFAVIHFERELTQKDAEYIVSLLNAAGVNFATPEDELKTKLIEYSPGGHIEVYIDKIGQKRISYGGRIERFTFSKRDKEATYQEFNLNNIIPSNITESEEDDFDWIRNVKPYPSEVTTLNGLRFIIPNHENPYLRSWNKFFGWGGRTYHVTGTGIIDGVQCVIINLGGSYQDVYVPIEDLFIGNNKSDITESEDDDWDWVKEVSPTYTLKHVKDNPDLFKYKRLILNGVYDPYGDGLSGFDVKDVPAEYGGHKFSDNVLIFKILDTSGFGINFKNVYNGLHDGGNRESVNFCDDKCFNFNVKRSDITVTIID